MNNNLIRKYGCRFLNRLKAKGIVDIPIANSKICNDQWSSSEIKEVLLRTSLNGSSKSIRDEIDLMENAPTSHTILRRLARDDCFDVLDSINQLLRDNFEKLSLNNYYSENNPLYIAIDGHYEPYYGEITSWLAGQSRKKSTNYFIGFVAMYIVHPGRPLLLGLTPLVENSEPKSGIFLFKQVESLLERFRVIFLGDGHFATIEMLKYLCSLNYDYIIRKSRIGRIKDLCESQRSQSLRLNHGFIQKYQMIRKKKGGGRIWTQLVVMKRRSNPRNKRPDHDILTWVTSMPRYGPKRLVELFKRRFRIENSFREMRPFLIKSCSKNMDIRFQLLWWAVLIHYYLELFLLTDPQIVKKTKNITIKFIKKPVKQNGIIAHSYLHIISKNFTSKEVKL